MLDTRRFHGPPSWTKVMLIRFHGQATRFSSHMFRAQDFPSPVNIIDDFHGQPPVNIIGSTQTKVICLYSGDFHGPSHQLILNQSDMFVNDFQLILLVKVEPRRFPWSNHQLILTQSDMFVLRRFPWSSHQLILLLFGQTISKSYRPTKYHNVCTQIKAIFHISKPPVNIIDDFPWSSHQLIFGKYRPQSGQTISMVKPPVNIIVNIIGTDQSDMFCTQAISMVKPPVNIIDDFKPPVNIIGKVQTKSDMFVLRRFPWSSHQLILLVSTDQSDMFHLLRRFPWSSHQLILLLILLVLKVICSDLVTQTISHQLILLLSTDQSDMFVLRRFPWSSHQLILLVSTDQSDMFVLRRFPWSSHQLILLEYRPNMFVLRFMFVQTQTISMVKPPVNIIVSTDQCLSDVVDFLWSSHQLILLAISMVKPPVNIIGTDQSTDQIFHGDMYRPHMISWSSHQLILLTISMVKPPVNIIVSTDQSDMFVLRRFPWSSHQLILLTISMVKPPVILFIQTKVIEHGPVNIIGTDQKCDMFITQTISMVKPPVNINIIGDMFVLTDFHGQATIIFCTQTDFHGQATS
ncbi:unnamed protein product [Mytilus coruscus]|uniref:Uncharacterized protein n=1 Tax=Mytilus coruscus TaxID=42192 RepID=A0A6J8DEB9_MYTCO|nr:unnamed protein product [Mytilus coruscus]